MPQDIDAERALLGSMLLEERVTADIIEVLRDAGSQVFARENHQRLYDTLLGLYDRSQPFDEVIIKQELVRRGFDALANTTFLADFLGAVPSALRARYYAGVVYDKYLLRQLINASDQVIKSAFDNDQPAREVLDDAEKLIFDVTERRVSGECQPLNVLVMDAFNQIQDRQEGALSGMPTGYPELDEMTSGLQRAEFIIIAGRPSMGKTAMGLCIAQNMATGTNALHARLPVLFFSLEMSRQQLAQRLLCSQARVDAQRLRRGRHSREDIERLKDAANVLSQSPLLIDDAADLSILELRARARMAYRRHDVQAIFVDYLQLMRQPRSENRQVEVATISRGLKALAKDLKVPVVAMAQLNRATEDKSRHGNKPRMSDLRESGAIEQDADVIMLLHRESYYKDQPGEPGEDGGEENTAELIIAKQRNGPVGKLELHWHKQYTRFENRMPRMGENYAPPAGGNF